MIYKSYASLSQKIHLLKSFHSFWFDIQLIRTEDNLISLLYKLEIPYLTLSSDMLWEIIEFSSTQSLI